MSDQNLDEMDVEVVILTDDEGVDHEFEVLDIVNFKDNDYAVLLPTDVDEMEDGVVILQIVQDGDEETYSDVDDDDLLDEVFEIFKERYDGEYDFEE